MSRPTLFINDAASSWIWWAYQEVQGKAYAGKSKYQRERWHLRSLHDERVLNSVTRQLGDSLSAHYGQSEVRLGSIWVDLTPQARAKFDNGKPKLNSVKCELADLIVVTMSSFNGQPPTREDVRALLVQAKVTNYPGQLDSYSAKSSSTSERNLLECCASPIELRAGTDAASALLGTYDLGCTRTARGLAKYSQYLTIPNKIDRPPLHPYQSMWPLNRSSQTGITMSLGEVLLDMLSLSPTLGQPLAGVGIPSGWPEMIGRLTQLYDNAVVDRFTKKGAPAFPRIQQSRLYSCFSTAEESYNFISDDLIWGGVSSMFSHGGKDSNNSPLIENTHRGGPYIPILLVQAKMADSNGDPLVVQRG